MQRKIVIGVLVLVAFGLSGYFLFDKPPYASGLLKCAEFSEQSEKLTCWQDLMHKTVKEDGVARAFSLLSELYETEEMFVPECHSYTHIIGEEAYHMFSQTGEVILTPEADACGYGFYHGFMETLLFTTGDLDEARDFCDRVDKELSEFSPGSWTACYHGFGHGVIDGSDPNAWGDADLMIAPGLELCEKVADTFSLKKLCGSGVYNSLAGAYFIPKYELKIKDSDPYALCGHQEPLYFKEACYEEMNTVAARVFGRHGVTEAFKRIQSIEDLHLSARAMRSFAGFVATKQVGDVEGYKDMIFRCQELFGNIKDLCIEGYVTGLIEGGEPGEEENEVFTFCAQDEFTEENRERCYRSFADFSKRVLAEPRYTAVCKEITRLGFDNACIRNR